VPFRLTGELLAFIPDVGRERPVSSDLLPHDDILPGDFLRRGTLRLQASAPIRLHVSHIERKDQQRLRTQLSWMASGARVTGSI
jgi:hypothetical protein